MGGDSFEGLQRLTNQQFQQISEQVKKVISHICQKIDIYIPFPQKQTHGDIDFMILLKEGHEPQEIIQLLKIEQYKIITGPTIHSVYKKKQIDFAFVQDQINFQTLGFYKSYGGFGGYLGVFFDSRYVKVCDKGFTALSYPKQQIKFQYTLTTDIASILQFFGLDPQIYFKGFKIRQELYKYMRQVRFLDQEQFIKIAQQKPKSKRRLKIGKIGMNFIEYLKKVGLRKNENITIFKDQLKQTLLYYGLFQSFNEEMHKIVSKKQRSMALNKKFNSFNIMNYFKIDGKQADKLKFQFRDNVFESHDKYYDFIEEHTLEEILLAIEKFKSEKSIMIQK